MVLAAVQETPLKSTRQNVESKSAMMLKTLKMALTFLHFVKSFVEIRANALYGLCEAQVGASVVGISPIKGREG